MERVNLRKQSYTLYAGRENKSYGFERSIFANPFVIGEHGNREEVIRKFEIYAKTEPKLLEELDKLPENTVFGCWCTNEEPCHCDILIKLYKERNNKPIKLGVLGGSTFQDRDRLYKILNKGADRIRMIVTTGSEGTCRLAREWSEEVGKPCLIFNHVKGDTGTVFQRNRQAVDESDKVIIFIASDKPVSRGALEFVEQCEKNNKPYRIINFESKK